MKDYSISIESLKRQQELCDQIKLDRLDNLLPSLMEETGIELWLIITGEQNEDPVYRSLVPSAILNASRTTCLAFVKEKDGSYGRYSINKPNGTLARFYKQLKFDNTLQWEYIADFIREKDPKTIGVNISRDYTLCSGLSAAFYLRLQEQLGDLASRIVSAEDLCVRWIETRTEAELAMYPSIYKLTTEIMEHAFSREVITPGITTTDEVEWWVKQEFVRLGIAPSFSPDVNFQRMGVDGGMTGGVIRCGDLLRYDMGIVYMGLATDHQRVAYVLKPGETEPPKGLLEGCRVGRRFADIVGEELQFGRTGNEVFFAAKEKAAKEGIDARLYSHPVGPFVHSAGPTIGLYDKQEFIPGRGEKKVNPNTVYAVEYNVALDVPEWGGQKVWFYLEETVLLRESGKIEYLDPKHGQLMIV
ncbi:MAG: M24 family metallopeptidase [Firmicutes bacterium]|nr:M24 family metallopeptidase [Bacillota bacterium]